MNSQQEKGIILGEIMSDSMEPLLKVGTKIKIKLGEKDLKRFDLIVFRQGPRLTCHFIWSMNKLVQPYLLQTQSLKNLGKDDPIGPNEYVGKVVSHKLRIRDYMRILIHSWFISKN